MNYISVVTFAIWLVGCVIPLQQQANIASSETEEYCGNLYAECCATSWGAKYRMHFSVIR